MLRKSGRIGPKGRIDFPTKFELDALDPLIELTKLWRQIEALLDQEVFDCL